MHDSYSLLDSGQGYKLEQFGPYVISRPCSQAVWERQLSSDIWDKAHAFFSREGQNKWTQQKRRHARNMADQSLEYNI